MEGKRNHKIFLIILKYIPHIIALLYVIYTLLSFIGIDAVILGHLTHISISSWIFMYISSVVFKYCYVHRLPLYYIALNDIITVSDFYLTIPLSDNNLLIVHLLLIALLIFGYSYYYVKFKLRK